MSPARLADGNEAVTELVPEELEARAVCTNTGAEPVNVTVAPLPLDAGLIAPEIE